MKPNHTHAKACIRVNTKKDCQSNDQLTSSSWSNSRIKKKQPLGQSTSRYLIFQNTWHLIPKTKRNCIIISMLKSMKHVMISYTWIFGVPKKKWKSGFTYIIAFWFYCIKPSGTTREICVSRVEFNLLFLRHGTR